MVLFLCKKTINTALTGKLTTSGFIQIVFSSLCFAANTYKLNNSRVAMQQQYACIVMDNGPLRTQICIAIENYMYIIIKEFHNF